MPFFIQTFSKILFGVAADSAKRHCSVTLVTKLGNSVASFGCAACLLGICYVQRVEWMLLLLSGGLALTSGYVPGYFTSIVCIAPNFTTAVSAYAQGFAQVASIVAPIAVGFMTSTVSARPRAPLRPQSSLAEWQAVFQMLSAMLFLTGLVFLVFGSASPQPWAEQEGAALFRHDSSFSAGISRNFDTATKDTTRLSLIEETTADEE